MSLPKKTIKNPFSSLKREGVSVKDEAFLIILNIGTVGAILSLIACVAGGNYESIPVNALTVLPCLIFCVLCRRVENIKFAKNFLLCVVGAFVFPFLYVYSGGINSGMLIWLVMVFCIAIIVLDGKFRGIICAAILISNTASAVTCYLHPELVKGVLNARERYIDTVFAFFAVVLALVSVSNYVIHRLEEINRQLSEAKKEAELATQAKSMFLASMSHEIRTPLNAILNLNGDILYTDDMEEIKENIEDVKYSAKVLAGLINNVLDFSKIERGKYQIVEKEYDSKSLISHINMLGSDVLSKGLEYKVEQSEINPLPEGLYGDDKRIKQIFTNLVSNSAKYTEKGNVSVAIEFIKKENYSREGILKMTVSDTGIGIKQSDLDLIFEAFERADLVQNIKHQGTGLGLAITKAFLNMMKGEISVDTKEGEGTTFVVTIPQKIVEIETEDDQENFDFSEVKILVCDDNEINLKVFTKILSPTNAKVKTVTSGDEVLELLNNETFDIIFLDYLMPQMDGMECMKSIKELGIETPVIVLTADTFDNPETRYLNMGFDDYLSKPIDRLDLNQKIKKYASFDNAHEED